MSAFSKALLRAPQMLLTSASEPQTTSAAYVDVIMQSCNQHRQHSAYVDCVGKLTYDGVGQKRAQIPKASKDKVTIGS